MSQEQSPATSHADAETWARYWTYWYERHTKEAAEAKKFAEEYGAVFAPSETPRIETSPEDMTASLRYLHLSTAPDGQWADQAVHSFVGAMLKSSPKAWSEMNGFERAAYNAGAEAACTPSATPRKPSDA